MEADSSAHSFNRYGDSNHAGRYQLHGSKRIFLKEKNPIWNWFDFLLFITHFCFILFLNRVIRENIPIFLFKYCQHQHVLSQRSQWKQTEQEQQYEWLLGWFNNSHRFYSFMCPKIGQRMSNFWTLYFFAVFGLHWKSVGYVFGTFFEVIMMWNWH